MKTIQTNNGKKGGSLVGKSHAEGGIKAVVVDTQRPIEVESGEVIINKHAAKKYWKELSEINQSAGNGVPIEEPVFAKGGNFESTDKKEIYKKWKQLVNMSHSELKDFYESKEGKEAGLTKNEAREQGIHSGRESAEWVMKMKKTPMSGWTLPMWRWAKRQISFINRMSGVKGNLYDDKGNKTRKHTSLLIWGHNPKKMGNGGEIKDLILSKKIELNFYRTTPDHALEYGIEAKNPLYLKNFHVTKTGRLKGIGKKMLKYLDDYAIENGNDVIFGYINQKATFTKNKETNLNNTQLIKNWLHDNGYAVNDDDNNFHKVVGAKMKDGGCVEFISEKKGTLIKGNEIIKYAEKVNGNYRLVFYKIKESNGKVPIVCDAFDYCNKLDINDVSADELIDLIEKNNLIEQGGNINDIRFAQGGGIKSDCIEFIKNTESITNNGYYLHIKNLNVYVSAGDKTISKVKSLLLITYNSVGQSNLKASDTINSSVLSSELAKILGCDISVARIIVSEQIRHSKRFSLDILNNFKDENIIVADRDKIECTNIISKFEVGGELIKRADGSYSKHGLWDSIRENAGSGRKPTKEMLEQEAKIKADSMAEGGSITCSKCNWSWDKKDTQPHDAYVCHKCGYDNELKKGIKAESEHIKTAKDLYEHNIKPNQAAKSIAIEHLKEDPQYYTKLLEKFKKGGNLNAKQKTKFGKVIREFYAKKLYSNDNLVTDKNQALAIAYSEANSIK